MEKARPSENFGKLERDQRKARQVGGDVVDRLAGLEPQAERRGAAGECIALGEPALAGEDDGRVGQRLAVARPSTQRIALEGAVRQIVRFAHPHCSAGRGSG